jgi:hypothetical protein
MLNLCGLILLVTVESICDQEYCCRDARAYCNVWLEFNLSRCQHRRIIAGQIPKFILPILFGSDEKVPWQQSNPTKAKQQK